MARGSATTPSRGEMINHFNAVRIDLLGSGDLKLTAWASNESFSNDLVPITMSTTTYIQPTALMNMKQHRMSLEFYVEDINEYFQIKRLNLFMKMMFTSVPQ